MQSSLSKALIAEFIGTFALIFIGAGVGALGLGGLTGVALAHGLVVLGFAYAYGHISGTHINPAVTCGLLAAGKIDGGKAGAYIVTQLIGGAAGAFALKAVLGGPVGNLGMAALASNLQAGGASISISPMTGLFVEFLGTFFLVNAVCNTAVSCKAGNLAGVAIGLTLTFGILCGGPLTGAAYNPARALGPALAVGDTTNLWIYFVGPILGGVVAGILYRSVFEER